MNIEVGGYIRDKYGIIFKVSAIKEEDGDYYFKGDKPFQGTWCEDVVKYSKNIINIIDVGDIIHLRDVLHEDLYYMIDKETIQTAERMIQSGIKLVGILTREQYEASCYRLED